MKKDENQSADDILEQRELPEKLKEAQDKLAAVRVSLTILETVALVVARKACGG